jgi:type 1 glutamine amidotransferase
MVDKVARMNLSPRLILLSLLLFALAGQAADSKKIVFVAGTPSHAPGDHEHRAGCLLLQKSLAGVPNVQTVVVSNGFPADASVFEGAAAIMIFADGGDGHPAVQGNNLKTLGKYMDQGAGLVALHYGVEVPKDKGGPEFLDWIGGYFETHWSVNPHWTAHFSKLPTHPITRGVKPFAINDEWYFHMRFREGMKGVTPILSAVPPASTMERGDGPHSGNPAVREAVKKKEPQHVAWAYERPNGGRGFGWTGAHHHRNWGNDQFRKLVLNAILWAAKVEVPATGVPSRVTEADLLANLDRKDGGTPSMKLPEIELEAEQFISPVTGR